MSKLSKRIASLEQKVAQSMPITIICNFVSVRWRDGMIFVIRDGLGNVWNRLPNESESEFKSRVADKANRNVHGVALLMADKSLR